MKKLAIRDLTIELKSEDQFTSMNIYFIVRKILTRLQILTKLLKPRV
jgi:hypothetical protein